MKTRLDMIRELSPGVGVEVGVQRGDFSAEILRLPIRRLFLVDAWNSALCDPRDPAAVPQSDMDYLYHSVVLRFMDDPRVKVLRIGSTDAAKLFTTNHPDWVYIDAGHTYENVIADLNAWSEVVAVGGCIMGHDYTESQRAKDLGFGVVAAVDDFCKRGEWSMVAVTNEEWPSFCLKRI